MLHVALLAQKDGYSRLLVFNGTILIVKWVESDGNPYGYSGLDGHLFSLLGR